MGVEYPSIREYLILEFNENWIHRYDGKNVCVNT